MTFETLMAEMTLSERVRFVSDVNLVARKPAIEIAEATRSLVEDWSATITVQRHPDFDPQLKEYRVMAESGELFIGLESHLEQSKIAELRDLILSGF